MNTEQVNELITSLESAGEISIKERKHLELAKGYQQLAAENLTMLRLLTDISENHMEYFSEGEDGMFAGVPLDYVSEINMYVSRDVNAENPFPATDRIVAGIKADEAKFIFHSILDNPAVTDLGSLVDWLEQHANDSDAVVQAVREGADK